MARKIGLVVYSFSLSQRKAKLSTDLENINDTQFIDLTFSFFKSKSTSVQKDSVFKVEHMDKGKSVLNQKHLYTYLYGEVKTGHFGLESEIIDVDNGETVFNKNSNHADIMPFKFAIITVPGRDTGLIILQTSGVYGIKTLITNELNSMLGLNLNGVKLIIQNVAPKEYLRMLFQSQKIKSIRLFQYKKKADIADRKSNVPYDYEYLENIFHNPRLTKTFIDKLVGAFGSKSQVNEIIGITGVHGNTDEYDNIKLDFKIGNSNKVVNYDGFNNLVISEDITNQVTIVNTHPDYDSVKKIVYSTAFQYLTIMGLLEKVNNLSSVDYGLDESFDYGRQPSANAI